MTDERTSTSGALDGIFGGAGHNQLVAAAYPARLSKSDPRFDRLRKNARFLCHFYASGKGCALERRPLALRPVTPEVAGSGPVGPANLWCGGTAADGELFDAMDLDGSDKR